MSGSARQFLSDARCWLWFARRRRRWRWERPERPVRQLHRRRRARFDASMVAHRVGSPCAAWWMRLNGCGCERDEILYAGPRFFLWRGSSVLGSPVVRLAHGGFWRRDDCAIPGAARCLKASTSGHPSPGCPGSPSGRSAGRENRIPAPWPGCGGASRGSPRSLLEISTFLWSGRIRASERTVFV